MSSIDSAAVNMGGGEEASQDRPALSAGQPNQDAAVDESKPNQEENWDQGPWDQFAPWSGFYLLMGPKDPAESLGHLQPLAAPKDDPQSQWDWIDCVMDSGAADMVIHEDKLKGYKLRETMASKHKLSYTSASQDPIYNKGETDVVAYTEDGLPIRMTLQAVDKLSKTLLSMRKVEQAGNRIVIGSDEPGWPNYVHNKKTGIRSRIGVKDGVYTFGFWLQRKNQQDNKDKKVTFAVDQNHQDGWKEVSSGPKATSAGPFAGQAK